MSGDLRYLFAVGRLDDLELLKKEVAESRVVIDGLHALTKDRLSHLNATSPDKVRSCLFSSQPIFPLASCSCSYTLTLTLLLLHYYTLSRSLALAELPLSLLAPSSVTPDSYVRYRLLFLLCQLSLSLFLKHIHRCLHTHAFTSKIRYE